MIYIILLKKTDIALPHKVDTVYVRPSKKKNHMFLVRISIKKESLWAGFLLFIISYCILSLHINIITFPQGYVGALRSNINKTKH